MKTEHTSNSNKVNVLIPYENTPTRCNSLVTMSSEIVQMTVNRPSQALQVMSEIVQNTTSNQTNAASNHNQKTTSNDNSAHLTNHAMYTPPGISRCLPFGISRCLPKHIPIQLQTPFYRRNLHPQYSKWTSSSSPTPKLFSHWRLRLILFFRFIQSLTGHFPILHNLYGLRLRWYTPHGSQQWMR